MPGFPNGHDAEPQPQEPARALAAFHSREFSTFWAAGLISNTGTWMQTVTVPYVVDQLTHSTALVGVSAFCAFFPATIVAPWAGSLADRYDRRSVLIGAQVVMMAMAAALWALWSTGTATTALILVCVVISGLGTGITTAAWTSFVPQLVPRMAMMSAVRVNSLQFTVARALGPALAGLVLATLGASYAFGLNALSFLVVIGALLVIRSRPFANTGAGGGVLEHFRAGIRYARRRQALVVAFLMVMLVALLGVAIVQLIEPIARHVFDVGPGIYGILTGGYGAGAVAGGLFMVWFGDTFRRSHLAFTGLAAMAAGDLLLGLAPVWGYALVALFVMGAAQVLCMVSCNTAIQVNVDEGFRGRASSIFTMSFFAAAPIGALVGGVIGEWLGLRATAVGAGVLLAGLLAWSMIRYHRLRPLDEAMPILDERAVVEPAARGLSALRVRDHPAVHGDHLGRVVAVRGPVAVAHVAPRGRPSLRVERVELARGGDRVRSVEVRRHRARELCGGRSLVGIVHEQLDLRTHALARVRELVAHAARVAPADARVVVGGRRLEAAGLDHRLREREVAAHVLGASLVEEDLRQLRELRGDARLEALRPDPTGHLPGREHRRAHHRFPGHAECPDRPRLREHRVRSRDLLVDDGLALFLEHRERVELGALASQPFLLGAKRLLDRRQLCTRFFELAGDALVALGRLLAQLAPSRELQHRARAFERLEAGAVTARAVQGDGAVAQHPSHLVAPGGQDRPLLVELGNPGDVLVDRGLHARSLLGRDGEVGGGLVRRRLRLGDLLAGARDGGIGLDQVLLRSGRATDGRREQHQRHGAGTEPSHRQQHRETPATPATRLPLLAGSGRFVPCGR